MTVGARSGIQTDPAAMPEAPTDSRGGLPPGDLPEVDPWAPVPFHDLPPALVKAFEQQDWPKVRAALADVMDVIATDGVYGRALLQLVRQLPLGIDPVFDQYRGSAAIDHGDWDDLRRCLAASPLHPQELIAARDMFLAPISRMTSQPHALQPEDELMFSVYEFEISRRMGAFRRWARSLPSFDATPRLGRDDLAVGRHMRYRSLHHALMNAIGEALAGRLQVALAFAHEAQRFGDEGEPTRLWAIDLEELIPRAMGSSAPVELRMVSHSSRPTGMSPYGLLEWCLFFMPFLAVLGDQRFEWATRTAERIAVRLGSPRLLLQATAWRVAGESSATGTRAGELPGLVASAQQAASGLRALPEFLRARSTRSPAAFAQAERLARRSGNVWLQVSTLTWFVAIAPTDPAARSLARLLQITGWRRPALVPDDVIADAALGLIGAGERGRHIVELARVAGRPNVTFEVASRHVEDATGAQDSKLAALEALSFLGTARAREIVRQASVRHDRTGDFARLLLERQTHPHGLTEREVEVLDLAARGLTNKRIAEMLTLSTHTIARHLANARAKLGAANRTEAAALIRGDSAVSGNLTAQGAPRRAV